MSPFWAWLTTFIVTAGGTGLIPILPGTMGSVVGTFFYWFLAQRSKTVYGLTVFVFFLSGIYCCGLAARSHGTTDPASIVWDEITGVLVAMAPAGRKWRRMLAAFLIYRLLDVAKPFPIDVAEALPAAGLAIMADDIVAGTITAGILLLPAIAKQGKRRR